MNTFVHYSVAVYMGLLLSGTIMVPHRSASAGGPLESAAVGRADPLAPDWQPGTNEAPDLLVIESDAK